MELLVIFISIRRNNDSIFDELQSQDNELIGDVDFGITGKFNIYSNGKKMV